MTACRSVLFLLPIVGVFCHRAAAQPDENRLARATKRADTIVFARIVGTVDTSPGVRARKAFETHWVNVLETWKDHDLAGRIVKVRPNGLRWTDGERVVLFLSYRGAGFYEAARVELSDREVERVRRRVRAIAGPAKPKLALRMRFVSCGCGPGGCACPNAVRRSFALQADGGFCWRSSDRHEEKVGAMSVAAANALVQRIALTKPRPLPDCGGVVEFAIADRAGTITYRTHSLHEPTRGSALVAWIEATVAEHGTARPAKR